MAKKVTKVVQKEETVTVCDVCGKELPLNDEIKIDVSWSKNCPVDGCYDDYGSFDFCSYKCFVKGINKLTNEVDADEDFYAQSFTINARGIGQEEHEILHNILKSMTEHEIKDSQ